MQEECITFCLERETFLPTPLEWSTEDSLFYRTKVFSYLLLYNNSQFINYPIFVVFNKFIYVRICCHQHRLSIYTTSIADFPLASPALINISCLLLLLFSKPQQIMCYSQGNHLKISSSTTSVTRQDTTGTDTCSHNGNYKQSGCVCQISSRSK